MEKGITFDVNSQPHSIISVRKLPIYSFLWSRSNVNTFGKGEVPSYSMAYFGHTFVRNCTETGQSFATNDP